MWSGPCDRDWLQIADRVDQLNVTISKHLPVVRPSSVRCRNAAVISSDHWIGKTWNPGMLSSRTVDPQCSGPESQLEDKI